MDAGKEPAMVARHGIRVYDIDSGEEVECISSVEVRYDCDGAVQATIVFYPSAQEMVDQ